MAIISKQAELQEELTFVYEELLDKQLIIEKELKLLRKSFNNSDETITINLNTKNNFSFYTNKTFEDKLLEYDITCHIIDIINDFKDIYGYFPEYKQMYNTLYETMLQLADKENYECAFFLKLWVDRIHHIIN